MYLSIISIRYTRLFVNLTESPTPPLYPLRAPLDRHKAEFWIDVLGCRSALELAEEPLGRLKRLMKARPRFKGSVATSWVHGL